MKTRWSGSRRFAGLLIVWAIFLAAFSGSVLAGDAFDYSTLDITPYVTADSPTNRSNTAAVKREYISSAIRYDIENNTRLKDALNAGQYLIFCFEGGSDQASASFSTTRTAALLLLIENDDGQLKIADYDQYSTSFPDQPAERQSNNKYGATSGTVSTDNCATLNDGIYSVRKTTYTISGAAHGAFSVSTPGKYATHMRKDGSVYTRQPAGIFIHARNGSTALSATGGSRWSIGCLNLGTKPSAADAFAASAGAISTNGLLIVDRHLYDQELRMLYKNDEAVDTITAFSADTAQAIENAARIPAIRRAIARTDGVYLTWSEVAGAEKYYIYAGTVNDTASNKCIGSSTSTSYLDAGAHAAGETWYYWVASSTDAGLSNYSEPKELLIPRLPLPSISSVTCSASGVLVRWGEADYADGYYVFRSTTDQVSWDNYLGPTTEPFYLDKEIDSNETYYYWVAAYEGKTCTNFSSAASITVPRVPAPANLRANADDDGVTLTWSAVSSVSGYYVYRAASSDSAARKYIGKTGTNRFVDQTAEPCQTYYYQIASFTEYALSGFSAQVSITTPEWTAPAPDAEIRRLEVDGGISAVIACTKGTQALAVCVQYSEEGKLLSVQAVALKENAENEVFFEEKESGAARVKLFVLDAASFAPLCDAAVR